MRVLTMITIMAEAFVDIRLAIDLCPVEVSGIGDVETRGEELRILNVILIPQECSNGGTEFDPLAFNSYLTDLSRQGRGEEINAKRVWWHSHVDGHAYFSPVDTNYMERFGEVTFINPWLISIVGNKRGTLRVRHDIFRPKPLMYEPVPIYIVGGLPLDELKRLYRERKDAMAQTLASMVRIVDRG